MALSANATRALEQVKMGLYMLYGADYFTEDEWIKIDGLIHKGQYVFTQGPPKNVLEAEEELLNFDDTPGGSKPSFSIRTEALETFELMDKEAPLITQIEISSPVSSTIEASPSSSEPTNGTSVEVSSDDESAPSLGGAKESTSVIDESQMVAKSPPEHIEQHIVENVAETIAEAVKETAAEDIAEDRPTHSQLPSNGGLALGYTQAQLDEVKAFNSGLTKAGQKKRPKYSPVEKSCSSSEWPESEANPTDQEVHAPSNHEIQTWASEVKPQAPATAKPALHVNKTTSKDAGSIHDTSSKQALIDQFIKVHGRPPKSSNDIFQPNNPQHRPKRPDSRASAKTAFTATSTAKPTVPAILARNTGQVKVGSVYVAQSSAPRTSSIRIEVVSGDQIKVLKHVSGSMYMGMNLRSQKTGQFLDSVFRKESQEQLLKRQETVFEQIETSSRPSRGMSVSTTVAKKLDSIESMNAAVWDDVPVSRPKTVAPAPIRPGGLATSRFAVLANLDSNNGHASQQDPSTIMTPEQARELNRLIDEKFEQILKAQMEGEGMASTRPSSGFRSHGARKEPPPPPIKPKANTCWYWATGKGCRFTAEECRDVHEFRPVGPDGPTNLRDGKPTWGSLADTAPPNPKIGQTCYFWARSGECINGASCKYLHEYGSFGVAPPPKYWTKHSNWTRWKTPAPETEVASVSAGGDADGELVLEEVNGGWGDGSTTTGWGEEKYKSPHVRALEEQGNNDLNAW